MRHARCAREAQPTPVAEPGRCVRLTGYASRLRRRAPPPQRDVRAPVRDPEPVRLRARVRRGGRARAAHDGGERRGGRRGGRDRRRVRQPARPHPGRSERSILLCAHLDTVPEPGVITPVLEDGGWVSGGDTILGADNKAAVAVILEVARRCAVESSPGRPRAALHGQRGERAGGRQGVRRQLAAQRLGLRLRPRDADRRDHRRVTDVLPLGGRVSRHRGARGHPAGGRAQRHRRRRARDRRDAARADRRGDDGEHRHDLGRSERRHEHRARALHDRRRRRARWIPTRPTRSSPRSSATSTMPRTRRRASATST